jgi:hypothetical protein
MAGVKTPPAAVVALSKDTKPEGMTMTKANGHIMWQGKSEIDGKPIALIAVGFATSSTNTKTGGMIQTYILRSHIAPLKALKNGGDVSICGHCPHRPFLGGDCYVNVGQAPNQIFKTFKRGKYTAIDTGDTIRMATLFSGRRVRFGSYGDPAAIPYEIWGRIRAVCDGNTGYTHQWRQTDPRFATLLMASTDSVAEQSEAIDLGFRSFRVKGKGDPLMKNEISCPASIEAGKRLTCNKCMACKGVPNGANAAKKASIAIDVHGSKKHLQYATA